MEAQKSSPLEGSLRYYKQLTIRNQMTKCGSQAFIASTIEIDLESPENTEDELSFQAYMHRENVAAINEAACRYQRRCLLEGYSDSLPFRDSSFFLEKQRIGEERQNRILDSLITGNHLFLDEMKDEIGLILKQQENLAIFLRQMLQTFGFSAAKELTFVLFYILQKKYNTYRQIIKSHPSIVPRFNCYQYLDEGCKQLGIQSSCFDQINLEQVAAFAENDIQRIAKSIYYADCELKMINLRQFQEKNPKADLLEEFTKMIKQISKSIFLTLAGGTQPAQVHDSLFDIPRDLSFTDLSEATFSLSKSLRRMPTQANEDEIYDKASKKIKLQ